MSGVLFDTSENIQSRQPQDDEDEKFPSISKDIWRRHFSLGHKLEFQHRCYVNCLFYINVAIVY